MRSHYQDTDSYVTVDGVHKPLVLFFWADEADQEAALGLGTMDANDHYTPLWYRSVDRDKAPLHDFEGKEYRTNDGGLEEIQGSPFSYPTESKGPTKSFLSLIEADEVDKGDSVTRVKDGEVENLQVLKKEGNRVSVIDPEDPNRPEDVDSREVAIDDEEDENNRL